MKQSLFLKQFFLYIGILLISFMVLGLIITRMISGFFLNEKKNILIQHGERIANQYTDAFYTGIVDLKKFYDEFNLLQRQMNATTFLIDEKGVVGVASGDMHESLIGTVLNEEIIRNVMKGNIVAVEGRLGGIFNETTLTVGYPVQVSQRVVGAILINISVPEIQNSFWEVYRAIIIGLAASGAVAFLMIYFSVKKITDPLIAMNQAAKVISAGDFDKRLEIKSQDEVGQLAVSFNQMAESLNETEKTKRDFISNVSHDLRSPLTSIRGFVEAMQDGTIPQEKFGHYLGIVKEETERMIHLSNDILDLNKIDGKLYELHLAPFDLVALARQVLESFETIVRARELQVELNVDCEKIEVLADRDKIERVFRNLIDNAIKFSDNGRKISVDITEGNNQAEVKIRDQGIGLTQEEQKHIFERFYKADESRGLNKNGNGLGLSIVHDFLKAHETAIEVKSEKGKGTTFAFSLKSAK